MDLINAACFKVMYEEFRSGEEESIQDLWNRVPEMQGVCKVNT
jgi:hypothetical protein